MTRREVNVRFPKWKILKNCVNELSKMELSAIEISITLQFYIRGSQKSTKKWSRVESWSKTIFEEWFEKKKKKIGERESERDERKKEKLKNWRIRWWCWGCMSVNLQSQLSTCCPRKLCVYLCYEVWHELLFISVWWWWRLREIGFI